MSFEAQKQAWQQEVGKASTKVVLIALAKHADNYGYCWPKQETIAEVAEMSVRSVQRHLATLEDLGLIVRIRRHNRVGHRSSDGHQLLFFVPSETRDLNPTRQTDSLSDKLAGRLPDKLAGRHYKEESVSSESSLSLELDDLEKNSPRDLLCAAFEENFFEVLLSEEPRRQMLWLALPSETIADAIAQANDAPGNFRTALKHRLDVDSGVAGLRTKKSSAGAARREPKPPPADEVKIPPRPPAAEVLAAQQAQAEADEALPVDYSGAERGLVMLLSGARARGDEVGAERYEARLRRLRTGDGARASPDPERDDEAKMNEARLRLEQQRRLLEKG